MMDEKLVLIGAGSAMFMRGLLADLVERGNPLHLALVDTDVDALQVAESLARKMIAMGDAPIVLDADTDRRAVLSDATAIICTVGVGGRRAWEQDVFIPREYGIYQPVGDSVMPGGTSRALRMIPAMVDIARDVVDLAPGALFFNYGNPMAPVCRAIHKATGAPVVGLCHGVMHVAKYLAKQIGVEPESFGYTAVGMNHLTWFIETWIEGDTGRVDAMPRLHEAARERLARMPSLDSGAGASVSSGLMDYEQLLGEIQPFSWHLFERFGAFPAVLDRHVTEFFPQFFARGRYYGRSLGVDMYRFEDTIARGDEIYHQMRRDALSRDPLPQDYFQRIGGEHEQVLEIIDSVRDKEGAGGRIYSVNLPNEGQVPNLPQGAILEAPAIAGHGAIRPLEQPPLPAGLVGTLATRLAWVETVVEAALEGSRDKVVHALVLDGSAPSLAVAERLADDLLAAQAQYLPQFARF
jgi:alpha-galactosidase